MLEPEGGQIYNPALALHFPEHLARRQYALLDHVIEFNQLKVGDLHGLDSDTLAAIPREDLRQRPEVAALLAEAESKLAGYRRTLEGRYGERLKLCTHAVVCIGLVRFVW